MKPPRLPLADNHATPRRSSSLTCSPALAILSFVGHFVRRLVVLHSMAVPNTSETRTFEADVANLLHLMVHSVYSDRDIFLRELISNGADACERLRYEAISNPALLGEDAKARITLQLDAERRGLTVEDNGIG
jgi:hypothetical protein